MKVLKNIITVTLSNITNFGTSFIIGFILPAILSISGYGNYRQFMLFMSFSYLFNFGYNDGIYIKYGGKELKDLDAQIIKSERFFVFIFQSVIFLFMLIYSIVVKDVILIMFSMGTFFNSLIAYYQNLFQAIGEFTVFSKGNIFKSVFNIFLLLIAVFILKTDQYTIYIMINVASFAFLYLFYDLHFKNKLGKEHKLDLSGKYTLFKIGFFILIANMSLTFVGNIGSWVVNWWFSIEDFAQYSFQNSLLNVILLIVNAVSLVFYNLISKNSNEKLMRYIKVLCLYIGVVSGLSFFLLEKIIKLYLPEYIPAISLLSVTFISIPYIMLSRILFSNLYKTSRSEMKYFKDSLILALVSIIIVMTANLFFGGNLNAIALATTGCYIIWFAYCSQCEFNFLANTKKENLILGSHLILFYLSTNILSSFLGVLVYLFYIIVVSFSLKNEFNKIIEMLKVV